MLDWLRWERLERWSLSIWILSHLLMTGKRHRFDTESNDLVTYCRCQFWAINTYHSFWHKLDHSSRMITSCLNLFERTACLTRVDFLCRKDKFAIFCKLIVLLALILWPLMLWYASSESSLIGDVNLHWRFFYPSLFVQFVNSLTGASCMVWRY